MLHRCPASADEGGLCCSGPMYAAVGAAQGTAQETVFPLEGAGIEIAAMQASLLPGLC